MPLFRWPRRPARPAVSGESVVPLIPSAADLAPTRSYHRPATPAEPESPPIEAGPLPGRFFLWVDEVGGYLVCLGSRVTLGQATADPPADIPLFADVGRRHAELSRDDEGYVLSAGRDAEVNGVPTKRAALASGDRITLGATCQLVFRRPVPLSPTARLEVVSGHRLPLAADGVFLMAESLVLSGDGRPAHAGLPDRVPGAVLLYRSKDGLGVRYDGKYAVNGKAATGRTPLPLPAVVGGDGFGFAVEPAGGRR